MCRGLRVVCTSGAGGDGGAYPAQLPILGRSTHMLRRRLPTCRPWHSTDQQQTTIVCRAREVFMAATRTACLVLAALCALATCGTLVSGSSSWQGAEQQVFEAAQLGHSSSSSSSTAFVRRQLQENKESGDKGAVDTSIDEVPDGFRLVWEWDPELVKVLPLHNLQCPCVLVPAIQGQHVCTRQLGSGRLHSFARRQCVAPLCIHASAFYSPSVASHGLPIHCTCLLP